MIRLGANFGIGQGADSRSQSGSLLENYTSQFSGAAARHRSNVALRAAKIDAELAYRARGNFLAHMNHELRTPLNAVVGFATMLKDAKTYKFSDEQINEYLDFILQSAELLLGHIDTLLELAAAESGGAKLSRQRYDLGALLHEAVETQSTSAEEVGVKIISAIEDDLPDVFIDPDKMLKAIEHLLENALSLCRKGDQIKVLAKASSSTASDGGWVYISIEDTGQGMTQEELSRSMRVFEQIHTGLDRKFAGAGIGLPVAKSFIELNGGRFNIKTEKDTGTVVRFALPLMKSEDLQTENLDPETDQKSSSHDETPAAWRKAS